MNTVGVVIIGRNEGERLRTCLSSIVKEYCKIVYVDSGSTDTSVTMAREMGAIVVELGMHQPFTAARARNAGFSRLLEIAPDLHFVQFVDGDCEVVDGWLLKAHEFLQENLNVAVVCGRRKERFPERSIYNRLCDFEWDTPIGEAKACGGDALVRINAYQQVGGFRDDLIAGEEPELCVRLRQKGWKVWRLDHEMTLHDAAMTTFFQWWKRSTRAGHAFAEGAYLHGGPPEYHWLKESRRSWGWGLVLPATIFLCATVFSVWALVLFLIYPLQVIRLYKQETKSSMVNFQRAYFLVLGKFPEMTGQVKFMLGRILQLRSKLIEYK